MPPRALRVVPALYVLILLLLPAAVTAGDVEIDGTFVSTVAAGTAPLEVISSTHVTNLNADLLDGVDVTALLPALSNVVLVAESGGHFTSIQDALDSITDAAVGNPYLVVVGPGIFTGRVVMKPYVDIQGSGRTATTISWSGGGFGSEAVVGATSAELRNLTVVQNGGGSDDAWAIHNVGTSPSIRNVAARSISTGVDAVAIRNSAAASPRLTDVAAHAASEGARAIHNMGGSPSLVDVQASVFGLDVAAIDNDGSSSTLRRVSAIATSSADDSGLAIGIAFSGGISQLTGVESSVNRGQFNRGFSIGGGATVLMNGITARAGGNPGTNCFGVFVTLSDLQITDGDILASECSAANQGIRSDRSDVQIFHSKVTALSGTAYGIYNIDGGGGAACTVRIHNTPVSGATNAINTLTGCTTRVGASLLGGVATPAGVGTTTCAGVYEEDMTFHASACPP